MNQSDQSAPLTSEEATKDWSEEDKAWLAKHVPEMLRTVAVRHGRPLFQVVMSAGAAEYALTWLAQTARHPEVAQKLAVLSGVFDTFCKKAIRGVGKEEKDFHECKADVERVAALKDTGKGGPNEKVSKGGIVLNS